MTDDTQEYEIKSVGIGISDSTTETLIVRDEDGGKDEYKNGDTLTLNGQQAKDLRALGVKLSKSDGSEDEDSDDNSDNEPNPSGSSDTMYP